MFCLAFSFIIYITDFACLIILIKLTIKLRMIQQPFKPLHNNNLRNGGKNTPTRQRQNPHTYQNPLILNRTADYSSNPTQQTRSMSPNKLHATKKPIINAPNKQGFTRNHSTANMRQQNNQYNRIKGDMCSNHPNKPAQYCVVYDDEHMNYCEKCAINLASKGFSVEKISQRSGNHSSRTRPQFNHPEFASDPNYLEIKQLMGNIDSICDEFNNKLTQYSTIDNHYDHQYQITNQYYEKLLDTIEQMRADHLNDLLQQRKKHSQIALIQLNPLSEDMKTIETIRSDISHHIETILKDYDNEQTKKHLNYYREEIMINYKNKVEEHEQFFTEVINYSGKNLELMLKEIENYLLDIWDRFDVKQKKAKQPLKPNNHHYNMQQHPNIQHPNTQHPNIQHPNTQHPNIQHKPPQVKNMNFLHQNKTNTHQQPLNNACRKLFEDSIELGGQASPQFKNI